MGFNVPAMMQTAIAASHFNMQEALELLLEATRWESTRNLGNAPRNRESETWERWARQSLTQKVARGLLKYAVELGLPARIFVEGALPDANGNLPPDKVGLHYVQANEKIGAGMRRAEFPAIALMRLLAGAVLLNMGLARAMRLEIERFKLLNPGEARRVYNEAVQSHGLNERLLDDRDDDEPLEFPGDFSPDEPLFESGNGFILINTPAVENNSPAINKNAVA